MLDEDYMVKPKNLFMGHGPPRPTLDYATGWRLDTDFAHLSITKM